MRPPGEILVPDATARAVFDIAIHSLDFGSGFLDNEQVDRLRDMAGYLGVDPREATPSEHRRRYCTGHDWQPGRRAYNDGTIVWKCERCFTTQYAKSMPDVRLGIPS